MEENYLAKWIADENAEQSADPILNRIKEVSGQLEAPEFDKKAIFDEIQEKKSPTKKLHFKWSIAASFLVLIGVAAFFTFQGKSVETKAMASKNVELPDKSQVILQSGSIIKFNSTTWSFSREVSLRGAAFFDVQKGKNFIVQTKHGKVSVLGTAFKVSTFQNQLQVRCYEGRVSVEKNGKKTIITAGERMILTKDNKRKITKNLELSFEKSGQNEYYVFKRSLAEISGLLEELYAVKINLNVQKSKHYTGFIPLYDLENALKIITKTYQIDYQQEAKNSYIFVDDESVEK